MIRTTRNKYFNFCKEKHLRSKSDEEFGKELPDSVNRSRLRIAGKREYYYTGIKLKTETKQDFENATAKTIKW